MKRITILITLCCLTLLSACRSNKEYSWNERLTLVIDTPQGPVTASSVTELHYQYFPKGNIGGLAKTGKRYGEAVVVDLGEGRYLFALLSDTAVLAYRAFYDQIEGKFDLGKYMNLVSDQVGKPARTIPDKFRPTLVTFDDINDPKTVREVKPSAFSAIFGKGYKLRDMTVQITEDVMSKSRIEKVLRTLFFDTWRSIHKESLDRGIDDPYFKSFLGQLKTNDFIRALK